jgi:hypothetical protein
VSPCLSAWSQEELKAFVCYVCGDVTSRMFINDNILFNSKRNIIDNFPIIYRLSLHTPLCSTHGGRFDLPNTVKVFYMVYPGRCGEAALVFYHSTPGGHPFHVRTTQINRQFELISRLPSSTELINIGCLL